MDPADAVKAFPGILCSQCGHTSTPFPKHWVKCWVRLKAWSSVVTLHFHALPVRLLRTPVTPFFSLTSASDNPKVYIIAHGSPALICIIRVLKRPILKEPIGQPIVPKMEMN
jgi:hypothetical protein